MEKKHIDDNIKCGQIEMFEPFDTTNGINGRGRAIEVDWLKQNKTEISKCRCEETLLTGVESERVSKAVRIDKTKANQMENK